MSDKVKKSLMWLIAGCAFLWLYQCTKIPKEAFYIQDTYPYVAALVHHYNETGQLATMELLVAEKRVEPSKRIRIEKQSETSVIVVLYNFGGNKVLYQKEVSFTTHDDEPPPSE